MGRLKLYLQTCLFFPGCFRNKKCSFKKVFIYILLTVVFLSASEGKAILLASGIKVKTLTGKLNSKGRAHIPPSKISLPALNLKEPNFVISAYLFIQTGGYWVSSRIFIDERGISLESSPGFRGYPYRIVIYYYE